MITTILAFSLSACERPGATVDWPTAPDAVAADLREWRRAAPPPRSIAPGRGPDILLIVVDTLRADRVGAYGGRQTPRIDAWARDATVFLDATSTAPWTLPAHASMFTGLLPRAHGARGLPLDVPGVAAPLGPGAPTLAEGLRERGWSTEGVVANRAFLAASWGLGRGFDRWFCEAFAPDPRGVPYPPADRVAALVRAALAEPSDRPRFLFVNFMDPHGPYLAREGFVDAPDALRDGVAPYGAEWRRRAGDLLAGEGASAATRAAWSAAYDAEVRYVDHELGALLDALPALGIDGSDLVILTSDHGEYLGEHDLVEHSKDVYEEALRVPMIVRGPGFSPGVDRRPVSVADVYRLALAVADDARWDPPEERLIVSELYWSRKKDLRNRRYGKRFDRIRRAYREGPHKVIVGSDGSVESYDLTADPREANPAPEPWTDALRARGEAWVGATPEAPTDTVQSGDADALRALGYTEE